MYFFAFGSESLRNNKIWLFILRWLRKEKKTVTSVNTALENVHEVVLSKVLEIASYEIKTCRLV